MMIITPNHFNSYRLLNIVNNFKFLTINNNKKLEEFVSFTRIDFAPQVKLFCDWCSIVNGYYSFLIDSINNNNRSIELNNPINKIKTLKLKLSLLEITHLYIFKTKLFNKSPYDKKIFQSHDTTLSQHIISPSHLFPEIYENSSGDFKKILILLTKSYHILQLIERRWCPFQHMKRIAMLEHIDKDRYDSYINCDGFDEIVKAGKILSQFENIPCHECVSKLNSEITAETNLKIKNNYINANDYFAIMCRLSRE